MYGSIGVTIKKRITIQFIRGIVENYRFLVVLRRFVPISQYPERVFAINKKLRNILSKMIRPTYI